MISPLMPALALGALLIAMPAAAEDGTVTISGKLDGAAQAVSLDAAAIGAFGKSALDTSTDWDWHEGVQHYEGIPALDLLRKAGAAGTEVTLIAADDYSVTFPLAELEKHNALFATALNGETLEADGFGPLWLVFDYDAMPEDEREAFTARSVWSLVKIEVQ